MDKFPCSSDAFVLSVMFFFIFCLYQSFLITFLFL
jgi:hypothetical protein